MIQQQKYSTEHVLLTKKVLSVYIDKFWNDIYSEISGEKHLLLMCKVHYSEIELGYKTLGHLRRVNFTDKELFIEYLSERLNILNESYTTLAISEISFSYIINEGLASTRDRALLQDLEDKTVSKHRFNNYRLPVSMVPSDYGKVLATTTFNSYTRYIVSAINRIYQIDESLDGITNKVTILGPSDFKWTDTKLSEGFMREIGKSSIYFLDGEIVLRKQILSAKPFRKSRSDRHLNKSFVTMDIETITKNNDLIPYLICAYNGSKTISSYANESLNQNSLFNSFITQLLTFFHSSSNTLVVYAHNLSGFDGIFLMKHLLPFGQVKPLLHNGKIITIKVKLNGIGYVNKTIIFKDSFLLLPLGLRKLTRAFSVDSAKGYFPFDLNNIFYKGLLPQIELWKNIPNNEYTNLIAEFLGKIWDFKAESIKYCELDCISLHQVLVKFSELIFNKFKVDAHKSLTLPSLAMNIYKTNYMPDNSIYQLLGTIEKDIRQSYTGGAVDVYIPSNRKTSFFTLLSDSALEYIKLYWYDANSLYPTVMATHPMPIGKPTYFEGDIRKIEPDAFGFFYCNITTPEYLEHPILQRRIKTSDGTRTIAGLGSWTEWICSNEMDNAIKNGYQFEIIKGYTFKTGELFSDYVNKMYNLRLEYPKGTAMNLIAKLLMNSLYGKFGMKLDITKVEMFKCFNVTEIKNFTKMLQKYGTSVQDYVQLGDTFVIIRSALADIKYDESLDMYHGQDINIAIASTITSGARVYMSAIKNRIGFNLYYSDTDSWVIDKPLPQELVGNQLGQFKLESEVDKAVFLAPKVYSIVTSDGQEIVKVKGIKDEISSQLHFKDLENLLVKDSSREFNQQKWFKQVISGKISISDVAYTLKVTSNKRSPIYKNGVFIGTKPYNYKNLSPKN